MILYLSSFGSRQAVGLANEKDLIVQMDTAFDAFPTTHRPVTTGHHYCQCFCRNRRHDTAVNALTPKPGKKPTRTRGRPILSVSVFLLGKKRRLRS